MSAATLIRTDSLFFSSFPSLLPVFPCPHARAHTRFTSLDRIQVELRWRQQELIALTSIYWRGGGRQMCDSKPCPSKRKKEKRGSVRACLSPGRDDLQPAIMTIRIIRLGRLHARPDVPVNISICEAGRRPSLWIRWWIDCHRREWFLFSKERKWGKEKKKKPDGNVWKPTGCSSPLFTFSHDAAGHQNSTADLSYFFSNYQLRATPAFFFLSHNVNSDSWCWCLTMWETSGVGSFPGSDSKIFEYFWLLIGSSASDLESLKTKLTRFCFWRLWKNRLKIKILESKFFFHTKEITIN